MTKDAADKWRDVGAVLALCFGIPLILVLVLVASGALVLGPVRAQATDPPCVTNGAVPNDQTHPATMIVGSGSQNSAPIVLDGGRYQTLWTARASSPIPVGCYLGMSLLVADGGEAAPPRPIRVIDTSVATNAPQHGEAWLYQVPRGTYYLRVSSDCIEWSLTIVPG